MHVTINLHKPENISKRITHVRLWKSVVDVGTANSSNYAIPHAYTLVDTIPLNKKWSVTNESQLVYDNVSVNLGLIAYTNVLDTGKIGPSYEAYTGIPEAIRISSIKYELSTQLNGFMYVGNCEHPAFEKAHKLIFRSRPHKYSMFDWTRDYVSLPKYLKLWNLLMGEYWLGI